MTRVAIVDTNGEIIHLWNSGADVEPEGAWESDKTKTVVHLTSDVESTYFTQTHYYKDGAWKERSLSPGTYYTWKDEAWVLDSDELWKEIRGKRNSLLYDSDWTQLTDCKLSLEKQGEWTEYRQVLRGIPATNNGVKHLNEVVWPAEPS
tara:strand:+ start:997 stop:1443 length:447 start_codon:yes stop_codon:yes gene_type:complete